MKMKALVALRSKLLKPCSKLLRIFRFKLKRPVFIKALTTRIRPRHTKLRNKASHKTSPTAALLSMFRSPRLPRKMDKFSELRSISEAGQDRMPLFPSPLTPAFMKVEASSKMGSSGYNDVEDACRSFENYLVEMIVEEGKLRDLMDVEELLYCWKNLTCPVFIDLVSRFYGELSTDLFNADNDNVDSLQ